MLQVSETIISRDSPVIFTVLFLKLFLTFETQFLPNTDEFNYAVITSFSHYPFVLSCGGGNTRTKSHYQWKKKFLLAGNPERAFTLMETTPIASGLTIAASGLSGSQMEAAVQRTLTEQLYKETRSVKYEKHH